MDDIFQGEYIRLAGDDPMTIAEAFQRWNRDSEYVRLLDDEPPKLRAVKTFKEWLEKELLSTDNGRFLFTIRTLDDDRLIGFTGLFDVRWNHGDAWLGIGLGERDTWGKGFGSDALHVILRYAFHELGLERVTLTVFEYNPRAIRAYEKVGFKHEGRLRKVIHRDGQRSDLLVMGILHKEWIERVKELHRNG